MTQGSMCHGRKQRSIFLCTIQSLVYSHAWNILKQCPSKNILNRMEQHWVEAATGGIPFMIQLIMHWYCSLKALPKASPHTLKSPRIQTLGLGPRINCLVASTHHEDSWWTNAIKASQQNHMVLFKCLSFTTSQRIQLLGCPSLDAFSDFTPLACSYSTPVWSVRMFQVCSDDHQLHIRQLHLGRNPHFKIDKLLAWFASLRVSTSQVLSLHLLREFPSNVDDNKFGLLYGLSYNNHSPSVPTEGASTSNQPLAVTLLRRWKTWCCSEMMGFLEQINSPELWPNQGIVT